MADLTIFISHTHADKAVADAIDKALKTLFRDRVGTSYSTKKELDGGIKKGEDWVGWIQKQVREAHASLILITPSSIQKPWVLWEAGAVQGAALAAADGRHALPLQFKLSPEEIPSPFAQTQVTDGLSRADMEQFFTQIVEDFAKDIPGFRSVEAGRRMEPALTEYLDSVEKALFAAPMTVTEASVQEWLSRIEDLAQKQRFSEVEQLHDWMNVAYGRDDETASRPIDLRIHQRLGRLYAQARRPAEAAIQFDLARRLAPRDIFVLRNLGKAYLDQQRSKDAAVVIRAIEALDEQAFVRNVENAALKVRWCRQEHDLGGATEILQRALERNKSSYYLANLLAEIALERGDKAGATEAYERVLLILEHLEEVNVWTLASALTAELALGKEDRALARALQLRGQKPTPDELASVERGLALVATGFGVAPVVERVRRTLREGTDP